MVHIVSKQKYKQAVSLLATAGSMVQMVGNALAAIFVSLIGYSRPCSSTRQVISFQRYPQVN